MLKDLFEEQKQLLHYFYDHLDIASMTPIFNAIKNCQGVVFFTGIGKSGFIAQKITATLMSTGTKSFFLSPTDALHGDLGMVTEKDLLVIFSKSGETEELLSLLPFLRNKRVTTIGVVSRSTSRLAKGVDLAMVLPCIKELCPFDLAPTTSTEIQLLFGDVLAVALMKAKAFTPEEFAKNHPGGALGRRLSLKVKDLMVSQEEMAFCLPSHSLDEVLSDFSAKRCGCLIVVDEKKHLKGIFTDGDLRRALLLKGKGVLQEKLSNLMTPTPKAVDANASIYEAIKQMEEDQRHPITILPVLREEAEVIGLIKMHDIIQAGI